jgi:hypothetical protein
MFCVIGVTAIVDELFILLNFQILFLQNIIKSSLKLLSPTTWSSSLIAPPSLAKSSISAPVVLAESL